MDRDMSFSSWVEATLGEGTSRPAGVHRRSRPPRYNTPAGSVAPAALQKRPAGRDDDDDCLGLPGGPSVRIVETPAQLVQAVSRARKLGGSWAAQQAHAAPDARFLVGGIS